MPSFRTIVAAVDFSDISGEVLETARTWRVSIRPDSTLSTPSEILSVPCTPSKTAGLDLPAVLREWTEAAQRRWRASSRRIRSTLACSPPPSSREPPTHAIVGYAEQHEADLIVIGSHGRGVVSRLLLGSVAERVLHVAGGRCSSSPIAIDRRPRPTSRPPQAWAHRTEPLMPMPIPAQVTFKGLAPRSDVESLIGQEIAGLANPRRPHRRLPRPRRGPGTGTTRRGMPCRCWSSPRCPGIGLWSITSRSSTRAQRTAPATPGCAPPSARRSSWPSDNSPTTPTGSGRACADGRTHLTSAPSPTA